MRGLLICGGTAVLWTALWAGAVGGENARQVDWRPWAELPVLHEGRIKPLDTLARNLAQEICGSERPLLPYPEPTSKTPEATAGAAKAQSLFPEGKARRFAAIEIVLGWLVDPEAWEDVPCILAGYEDLRKEVLGVPLVDAQGNRLKFVTPRQVAESQKFFASMRRLTQRDREESPPADKELELRLRRLARAYERYRDIAAASSGNAIRWRMAVMPVLNEWRRFPLAQLSAGGNSPAMASLLQKGQDALAVLESAIGRDAAAMPSSAKIDAAMGALAEVADALAQQIAAQAGKSSTPPPAKGDAAPTEPEPGNAAAYRAAAGRMAAIARQTDAARMSYYDSRDAVYVVPALSAAALERYRNPEESARPWLSLEAVVDASPSLLAAYPKVELDAVRQAWRGVAAAYAPHGGADDPGKLSAALASFADSVRALGEAIEPLRDRLPIEDRDQALIDATAYPRPGAMRVEWLYNRADPFQWLWVFGLVALVAFAMGWWLPRTAFWSGLILLAAAQVAAVGGLAARAVITGLTPIGGMFETIVFVAMMAALFGTCFTLWPLFQGGLTLGWRLSAIPGIFEAAAQGNAKADGMAARAAALAIRAALSVAVLYFLLYVPYGGSDEGYTTFNVKLTIDEGSTLPTVSHLLSWLVSLALLALCVWLAPRAIISAATGLVATPLRMAKTEARESLAEAFARKPFAWVGAALAFLAGYVACNTTVFHKEIGQLMPVIRDNFWLTWHVQTIVAGYAAGVLAWGLGNIALCCYLFGRYTEAAPSTSPQKPGQGAAPAEMLLGRLAPPFCSTLAGYNYRAMQVAVVLLSAGTILGAVWADRAWGRFWGWDPKEIWALIAVLVYLAILHARYVRWVGDFMMAVGACVGAGAIIAAWYLVNVLAKNSLHAYGSTNANLTWVGAVAAVNLVLVLAAAARYMAETRKLG